MGKALRTLLRHADEEHEEASAASLSLQMGTMALFNVKNRTHGGSPTGKAANMQRDCTGAHLYYMRKCFWSVELWPPDRTQYGPEQDRVSFERRFRMSYSLFRKLFEAVTAHSIYLR